MHRIEHACGLGLRSPGERQGNGGGGQRFRRLRGAVRGCGDFLRPRHGRAPDEIDAWRRGRASSRGCGTRAARRRRRCAIAPGALRLDHVGDPRVNPISDHSEVDAGCGRRSRLRRGRAGSSRLFRGRGRSTWLCGGRRRCGCLRTRVRRSGLGGVTARSRGGLLRLGIRTGRQCRTRVHPGRGEEDGNQRGAHLSALLT